MRRKCLTCSGLFAVVIRVISAIPCAAQQREGRNVLCGEIVLMSSNISDDRQVETVPFFPFLPAFEYSAGGAPATAPAPVPVTSATSSLLQKGHPFSTSTGGWRNTAITMMALSSILALFGVN